MFIQYTSTHCVYKIDFFNLCNAIELLTRLVPFLETRSSILPNVLTPYPPLDFEETSRWMFSTPSVFSTRKKILIVVTYSFHTHAILERCSAPQWTSYGLWSQCTKLAVCAISMWWFRTTLRLVLTLFHTWPT